MPELASGFLCFGPSFFASVAFTLTIIGNQLCDFVSVDDSSNLPMVAGNVETLGLWCYKNGRGSWSYSDSWDFDDEFHQARAFSITAASIGGCVWLFYLLSGCMRFGKGAFKVIGFFGILATLFEGLTFFILRSYVCDNGCPIDTGAKCAISAIVFWFCAGIFSCGAGKDAEGDGDGE
eukprot:CAMPEP_0185737256 /NCGR_PEP_ID=MMETSP1171-20130828/29977_1 /TAXON_ID=374046 /ORGANISM="Helicotheca tamensis, Strain CCMP826" /LENGTH=177 /DNA_ID=CAMNT_0028408131 /DNA_START=84 /DNA_END=617 /DNA_ORIENTATION=+